MQTISAPNGSSTVETLSSNVAKPVLLVVGATLLLALSAHVAIPLYFTPVPLTLQTFAVLLVGLLLGPQAAFAALAVYLAEGASGLPVFNPHGPGGLAQMRGLTGGFLLSYPFAAAAAGALYNRARAVLSPFASAIAAGIPASIVIFGFGAGWLALLTHAGASTVWAVAVAPFLPGEVIKMAAAAACVAAWQRWKEFRPTAT